jgi:hypothetical protein
VNQCGETDRNYSI